jgi:hypothetical protein
LLRRRTQIKFDIHIPWKVLSSHIGAGISTDGWNLADSRDDFDDFHESRVFTHQFQFAGSFSSAPVVDLGITGFDMDQHDIEGGADHEHDFTACTSTRAGSRAHALEFHWFAIGA